jgi:hypothetical protein
MMMTMMMIIIIIITPCSRALPEKLTGLQLVNKFPTFNGTRRLITTFTNTCPNPEPDQCSPCLPTPLLEDPL